MMLSNGLTEDDAKGFKYVSDASNGLQYHINVESYSRTPGSRQPSPSEEDLTKNHSPSSIPIAVPIKADNLGLPANNSMVSSLTGQMVPGVGLANGIGPMSALTNGGGPPGNLPSFFKRIPKLNKYPLNRLGNVTNLDTSARMSIIYYFNSIRIRKLNTYGKVNNGMIYVICFMSMI